jgi:AraC-like DNA-binding protein
MALSVIKRWEKFGRRCAQSSPLEFNSSLRHEVFRGQYGAYHSHPAIEIVFHRVGSGVTRLANGRELHFREGSAVVYAPFEQHDQTMEKEGEDLCVYILVPTRMQTSLEGGFCVLEFLASSLSAKNSMDQSILSFRATAALLSLIQLAASGEEKKDEDAAKKYVQKADHYIRDHFKRISNLAEVADHVGISHDHLRHIFKTSRGKPLIQHLNEVRVERAKSLLIYSRLPLKQIAALCGYADEYYFSAVFRRCTRLSPGSYRRSRGPVKRV